MRISLIATFVAAFLPAAHGAAFTVLGPSDIPAAPGGVPVDFTPAPFDTRSGVVSTIPLDTDGNELGVSPDVTIFPVCPDCVMQNGYTGKLYLSTGTSITMTLPEGTKYFIFYAVGNTYDNHFIKVTFENGEMPPEPVTSFTSDVEFIGFLVEPMAGMGNPVKVESFVDAAGAPAVDPAIADFYTVIQGGTADGDPHFKTWNGLWYDFHGACDLVFLKNPDFDLGAGMDIQLRTTQRYQYSYIESAALRIGNDILQVDAYGQYYVNGIGQATMPMKLDGKYTVTYTMESDKKFKYTIDLGDGKYIVMQSFKDLVGVKMDKAGSWANFGNSTGLMGDYVSGDRLSRNGTIIHDADEFGNEWQVLDTEDSLFVAHREPQFPTKCTMPGPTKESRRLGESIAEEAAAAACDKYYDGAEKELCIYDVMASGDLELAQAGAY